MESEHFLLGFLREDLALVSRFLGPNHVATNIRAEIERQITRHERISASVEVPLLTDECKKILNLAGEESGWSGAAAPKHSERLKLLKDTRRLTCLIVISAAHGDVGNTTLHLT
jgi:hypothetical protein